MKYLILVIISLFCLVAFSDHKERKKTYPVESYYYDKEKKPEEWKKEDEKKRISEHLNTYMYFERAIIEAEKGNPEYEKSVSYWSLPYDFTNSEMHDLLRKTPDCTKERLEKNECPKAPYQAIYWAKKALESGYCIRRDANSLRDLIVDYVIPKTDMKDSEEFFHLLAYLTVYFSYQYMIQYSAPKGYKEVESKAATELMMASIQNPDEVSFDPKKPVCEQGDYCDKQRQKIERYLKGHRSKEKEFRNKLSEKQKKIADKMINDLIQKWSKKWGKDKVYQCRGSHHHNYQVPLKTYYKNMEEFLEKKYPHH